MYVYLQYLTEAFEIAGCWVVKQRLGQIANSVAHNTEPHAVLLLGHVDEQFAEEKGESSQILAVTLHQIFAVVMNHFTPK